MLQDPGKHICVRTCNVDVHIRLDVQAVYDLLKGRDFLYFIQENVGLLSRTNGFSDRNKAFDSPEVLHIPVLQS